ncbi:MAG: LysR family transcriptional regulator [Leptolyngbyaceae cyanobacterium SM1_4_3]|nr:LysR family transcriptional regulator [Leptolyngbyaceae cyanobacterium SM1_4_3]NJN89312.1 LysR family transcriptional regulator [Leptolyngbyaceae cyanobacterium SL_5_14]
MELRQLHYFVATAEELHFGRAADRLQMTQPALSKQIAALEKELDVQLLARTKRVVQLTTAGQVFFERAKYVLLQVDETIQLTKRTARGEEGVLTIGFTTTAMYTILPALSRRFRDRHPQVALNLLELSTEAQVAALNQGEIDLAFLHPPIDLRGLSIYPISEESFIAVLPQQHPLAKQAYITLDALARESFILHPRKEGPVLYDGFIQLCHQSGFHPKIVREVSPHQTRICLVAAGMGITFVPKSVQSLVSADVVCRPVEDVAIKLQFAAAWRQNRTTPTVQRFLELLQDVS